MVISTEVRHFCHRADGTSRPLKDVLTLIKNAGFPCVDLLCGREEIKDILPHIQSLGLTVNQSHAPFNRYQGKDYAAFAKDLMESARLAHELGAKILVAHGDEFDFKSMTYSFEAALEFNYKLFYPVVDYLTANGMKLAFENLFPDRNIPRFCSKPEELRSLIEKFPKEVVGVCWDTGHGKIADPQTYIPNMVSFADRLIATHIHDNYYGCDLHLFPFLGNLDFKGTMKALKDIGYAGELTYEFVYDRIPDEFLPDVLGLLYKMAEYLMHLS